MLSFHADVVGSLLRPPERLQAQKQLGAGTITPERFKEIEDGAVDEAIALQEAVGLEVITDGEMRRQFFQSQMTAPDLKVKEDATRPGGGSRRGP